MVACKSQMILGVRAHMKPLTGSKDLHLSFFIPFTTFAYIFSLGEDVKIADKC